MPNVVAMKGLAIYCADIGSVARGRFAWYGGIPPSGVESGSSIDELASKVASRLDEPRPVALGFECPLFVPITEDPTALTSARMGEGNRPWSAGAGAGALTTGLVEVLWILNSIRHQLRSDVAVDLDWNAFRERQTGLFLWEAFVSGRGKTSGHSTDAQAAVQAFVRAISDVAGATAIPVGGQVFSLVGAALLRTGWSRDLTLLTKPCAVIKA
jgi:hypothetical protein